MPRLLLGPALLCAVATASAHAQASGDSAAARPPWQGKVLYGGGPSIGGPPSGFTGTTPPDAWCLQPTGRTTGDYAGSPTTWMEMSLPWLQQVLRDTGELGTGWRRVLGGAPQLVATDSVVQVLDEQACHALALTINRDLLGWKDGPPPVVVLQARDYLVVFPSASMGEFGLAVGMKNGVIQGVSTW